MRKYKRTICAAFVLLMASGVASAASFNQSVSQKCLAVHGRLTSLFGVAQTNEFGSAFEVKFLLPAGLAAKVPTDVLSLTLSCNKREGKEMRFDNPMGYVTVEYDRRYLREGHQGMSATKFPDEAVMSALAKFGAASLGVKDAEGANIVKSCFQKALSKPTEKDINDATDERTYFAGDNEPYGYECTRRLKIKSGETVFLMHFNAK